MKKRILTIVVAFIALDQQAQIFSAQNGLNNTTNPSIAELGGTLINQTQIDLNSLNLVFNKRGRFGVGGNVTTANLSAPISALNTNNAKIVFDNGDHEETQKIYAYANSSYPFPNTYGLSIQASHSTANTISSGAVGIASHVTSEGSNKGFESYVGSSNSNLVGTNTGVHSISYGGLTTLGGSFEGGQALSNNSNILTETWGVLGKSIAGYTSKGVQGLALNGIYNYGGYFQAEQTNVGPNYISNIGVYGDAGNAPNINLAVYGHANGGLYSNCLSATGIYGYSRSSNNVIAVKGECPPNGNPIAGTVTNLAGQFIGDVMVTGVGYDASYSVIFSDQKIKRNVKPLHNALDLINSLSPKTYNLTNENCKQLRFENSKTQFGLIAQEVEAVMPDIVYNTTVPAQYDSDGKEINKAVEMKGVSYEQLISVLIKGTQEQQQIIENLKKDLGLLEQRFTDLAQKSSNTVGINNLQIETGFQMSQNEPNPFTHETVVKYTIPVTVSNAFMAVYDLAGKQITHFPLEQKGSASLTITSEKLAAGIYIYSIVADGKVVDSKKMIVAEK